LVEDTAVLFKGKFLPKGGQKCHYDFIETILPDVAISINAIIFYKGQNLPTIFLHESDRKMLQ
jgi:hypothetical protein